MLCENFINVGSLSKPRMTVNGQSLHSDISPLHDSQDYDIICEPFGVGVQYKKVILLKIGEKSCWQRWGILACLVFFTFSASAIWTPVPDKKELTKEQDQVRKTIRPELEAGKAGLKTNADLGALFEDMARKTEFAPARYLLQKESFLQFVLTGDIPEIEKSFDRIKADYGSDYALSIARSAKIAIGRLVVDKKPGAKEFRIRLGRLEDGLQKIAELKKQAKTFSIDHTTRRRLAAAYAALGDWDVALSEYANCGDNVKSILEFEQRYPKTGITALSTADVAEFWWHEAETCSDNEEAVGEFRTRAVKWFKFAIENGTLQGEERKIAQKRVSEFEWRQAAAKAQAAAAAPAQAAEPPSDSAADAQPPSEPPAKPVAKAANKNSKAADKKSKAVPAKSAAKAADAAAGADGESEEDELAEGTPPPDLKSLPEELGISFVACPAARPFWISKDNVALAKYRLYLEKENRALELVSGKDNDLVIASQRDAAGFCAYLQRWHGSKLPIGLRFRLPLQMEWEFLCKKALTDKADVKSVITTPIVAEDPNNLSGYIRVVIGPPLTENLAKGTR